MKFLPAAALIAMILCGGCAVFQQNEARQQEIWLREAGFRVIKADTPAKQVLLAKMTPHKIETNAQGDAVLFRYANPEQGRVYVGGPHEFAAYQQIAVSTKARRSANLTQIRPGASRVTGPLVW